MSKSDSKESSRSPLKDKVSVATKHLGVFMETAEFEAETGTTLHRDLEENKVATTEKNYLDKPVRSQESHQVDPEVLFEPHPVKKKVHPRTKKKRFTLKKTNKKPQHSVREENVDFDDTKGSISNQDDRDIEIPAPSDASIDIDNVVSGNDDVKTSKLSSVEKENNVLRENEGGEIEIASHAPRKSEKNHNSLSEESLNVVSSSNPSDVDAEAEKNINTTKSRQKTMEDNESDEDKDNDNQKTDLPSAEPVVTRRSRRQEKRKEAEKDKEIKVESGDENSNEALASGTFMEHLASLGSRREYPDVEENMDDSASANERFEVDSIDGSELEDIDSVDSGSTLTRPGEMGPTKSKTKKPHRKTSARKGSAKGGKGNKSKGTLGNNSKGKSRRAIFKKSATKAPAAVATAMTSDRIYNKGQYFCKGDIVSVVDMDGGIYYAQLKGFLTDQYCEKSGVITWLLPTTKSPSPESGFDPATYVIGPEEDLPRKMDFFTFVMHATDDYFYYKNAPYPTNKVVADQEYVMTRMGPKIRLKAPDKDENSIPFKEESYYFSHF